MTDEELVAALRSRTKKVLSKNWLAGRECPECGSEADRPKCMWDFGPNCPRLDPDNYSPPAWEYVPDKDCATAADRLKALAAAESLIRAQVFQEIREAAGRGDVVDAYNALVAECRLKQALEPTTAFLVMFNRIVGDQP